jgi:hypothetical protein
MLHEFLTSNRQQLISRCRKNAARRFEPTEAAAAIDHGVPLFLEQLVETLRAEQGTHLRSVDSEAMEPPTEIGRAAALHGAELLRRGLTVGQVVHDYGDVCQCITTLAVELDASISTDEFRTLNRCLDNAIANAVASFGVARQVSVDRRAETWQQRVDAFSIEQGRLIDIASHSLVAIKTGDIGINGATGRLLAHTLEELRSLAQRSLPEILLAPPRSP